MGLLMATGLGYKAIYAFSIIGRMVLPAAYDSSGKPIHGTYNKWADWQEEFQSWFAVCRSDYFGVTNFEKWNKLSKTLYFAI